MTANNIGEHSTVARFCRLDPRPGVRVEGQVERGIC